MNGSKKIYIILLHLLILALLALPIIFSLLEGQPKQHQATAAAWAIGLLFLAGLWGVHFLLSSGLLIWRLITGKATLLNLPLLHLLSAALITGSLYLYAVLFG